MADLLKKKLWGFNVVGAQGVNSKNDIEVGVTGGIDSTYNGLPAIRVGNKLFTPLGNVIEGEDGDYKIEEQIPDIPEDVIEEGKNYVLALDADGAMVWKAADSMAVRYIPVTFKGFTADLDKDYKVSINNGEILLNNSQSFDGGPVPQCTIMLKAGDEIDISLIGEDCFVSQAQIEYTTSTGELHSDDDASILISDGLVIGETWMSLVIDLTLDK